MPKSVVIDPRQVCQPGMLALSAIPLNQYVSDFSRERQRFGEAGLRRIYRDMALIREFETMLHKVKTQGSYAGVECSHLGPAHLSVGQEAAVVGQSAALDVGDLIFGSHRSHGEILAKCLSAVDKLDEVRLQEILEGYADGACLRIVEREPHSSIRDLAIDFALYGTLAEILGRAAGFNGGLGGSMHAFFSPFGSMPNNAIVGGSADISVGAALFKRIQRQPGVVVANLGDGALGCGPVWEAMTLASMEQYSRLWDKTLGGPPPVLFNIFNNFYGMGGQTAGETMGFEILARVGAAMNPDNLHAERVNGCNPLAVADATERKKRLLLEGRGPALLDVVTYRFSGHSPSDASSYRTREEMELWREVGALKTYGDYLYEHGVMTRAGQEQFDEEAAQRVRRILDWAACLDTSPRVAPGLIEGVMFSGRRSDTVKPDVPEVLIPLRDNPRVKSLQEKARFAFGADGKPAPRSKVFCLRDALFEALIQRFYEDPTLVAWGEENRDWGGAFGVYRGLTESLPYHRLFNAPISEGAIVGAAVGYALCGGRVVAEIMYCDFLGRAGDELFNQMAKWQAMSAGRLCLPLVLRVSIGSKYGAQHSQDWTAFVAHVPGLKAMYPVTPYDAKGMLHLALTGTDPVVFFESQKTYDVGELFVAEGVPRESYEIPEGRPALRRSGNDLTIITLGPTLYQALEAADHLARRYGLNADVIDLRFLNPLDYEPLAESVTKTGRVVLASDACERGSFLNDVAANLTQLTFDYLDAPPVVVGARNWITPPAELESWFYPQAEWILDAVHERLVPLPGHRTTTDRPLRELVRRARLGA